MAGKKTISRKELLKKPDEFLSFSTRALQVFLEHRVLFSAILVVCIGLASGVAVFRYVSASAEDKAFAKLQNALGRYHQLAAEKSDAEAFDNVSAELRELADSYANRDGGKLAAVALAHMSYNAGKIDEAAVLYRKALDYFPDTSPVREILISSLGYCSEADGDPAGAIDYFKMNAEAPGTSFMKDDALLHLGFLYEKTGKSEQSQESFKQLATDFPTSLYADLAKEKVKG